MGGVCRAHGGMRNACKILVGKPEGKRELGKRMRRLEFYIKKNRTEIWLDGEDWIHLASDRDQCRALVNTVMNLRVP
jgi:hypothetical protein